MSDTGAQVSGNRRVPDWITAGEASDLTRYHTAHQCRLLRTTGGIKAENKGEAWCVDAAGTVPFNPTR